MFTLATRLFRLMPALVILVTLNSSGKAHAVDYQIRSQVVGRDAGGNQVNYPLSYSYASPGGNYQPRVLSSFGQDTIADTGRGLWVKWSDGIEQKEVFVQSPGVFTFKVGSDGRIYLTQGV